MTKKANGKSGFTLIELLVVVAIIAMLVSILLPAVGKARQQAYKVKCMTNARTVGQAMMIYTVENKDFYPASYLYPYNDSGSFDIQGQDAGHDFGYLHWSYYLFESGEVSPDVFSCAAVRNGGAPRTNPGSNSTDWEGDQVDQNGQSNPNGLEDKQAPRMAYTANAALVPRNKFTTNLGGVRVNRFVKTAEVRNSGNVILASEFTKNWKAVGTGSSGSVLSKSHRPVTPFWHVSAGFNTNAYYQIPTGTPGFVCGTDADNFGILSEREIERQTDILGTGSIYALNAIGRHHPGGGSVDKELGGTANFLFCDGRVENMHVIETIEDRLWGDRFYSLSGHNNVKYRR